MINTIFNEESLITEVWHYLGVSLNVIAPAVITITITIIIIKIKIKSNRALKRLGTRQTCHQSLSEMDAMFPIPNGALDSSRRMAGVLTVELA